MAWLGGGQPLSMDAPQAHLCAPPPPPGLRWALIAAAVVAGILVVSCLLCAICCCCRGRHRKEPRDEEAMGLGSARSTINTHLVRSGHPAGPVPGGSPRSRLGGELSPQHGLVCPERRRGRGGRLAGEAMNKVREGVGCGSHSSSGGGQWQRGGLGAVSAGPAELSWDVSPSGALARRFDPSWTRCLGRRGSDGARSQQHLSPAPVIPPGCSQMWMRWSLALGGPSSGSACSCPWSTTLEARR